MPSLNYATAVHVTGAYVTTGRRYYDGSGPGHTLTRCPRCLRPADSDFPHDRYTPGCADLARAQTALRAELAARDTRRKPARR